MSGVCVKCARYTKKWSNHGHFVRESDKRRILRYKCEVCGHVLSQATYQECYRQKKRKLNPRVYELLCSGVSQRRIAKLLKINRKTVVRKFLFLAKRVRFDNFKNLMALAPLEHIQFDDLETIEHTKCKPLSVTMAVEESSRRILAFSVSQMPAKGHLAKMALKKYGYRQDLRSFGREEVFLKLATKLLPEALVESDDNPHYKGDLKKYLPHVIHKTFLGQRGSVRGQGELKKVVFDPLFTLNHTFAMLRANINRLFRKTWCTTKRPDRLRDHIELYVHYHNEVLLRKQTQIVA